MAGLLRRFKVSPIRTVLTVLQVLLASFTATLSLSAFLAPSDTLSENTFYLVAGQRDESGNGQTYSVFEASDLEALSQLTPDVETLGIYENAYNPELIYNDKRFQFLSGATVSPEYFDLNDIEVTGGSAFSSSEAEGSEAVLMISEDTAKIIFGEAEPVGQSVLSVSGVSSAPTPYRVVGVFADGTGEAAASAPAVYFPVWAPGGTVITLDQFAASTLIVKAEPGRSEEAGTQLLQAVRGRYEGHPQLAGVELGRDFYLETKSDVMGLITPFNPNLVILGLFGVMILVIGSIGVFSNSVVSVVERKHEIGLKRALGATGGAIGRDFAVETLLLALVGSLIGAALAAAAIPPLFERLGGTFFGPTLSWQPAAALIAVGVTAVLSATLGLWPAYRAGRLIPLANLRD